MKTTKKSSKNRRYLFVSACVILSCMAHMTLTAGATDYTSGSVEITELEAGDYIKSGVTITGLGSDKILTLIGEDIFIPTDYFTTSKAYYVEEYEDSEGIQTWWLTGIVAANLEECVVTVDTVNKTVVVEYDGEALTENSDYTVAYYKKNGETFGTTALTAFPTDAGTYKATLTAATDSFYYVGSTDSDEFTVESKDISSTATITKKDGEILKYDGTAKIPTITVKDGDTDLTVGTDYEVQYEGVSPTVYSKSSTAPTAAGDYKVIFAFQGNYTGTKEVGFNISKADALSVSDLTDAQKPAGKTGLKHNGLAQELVTAPTGALPEGYTKLQYSLDGTTWTDTVPTGTDAGTYTIKTKYVGDDNHTDFFGVEVSVKIAEADPQPDPQESTQTGKNNTSPDIAEAHTQAVDNPYTSIQPVEDNEPEWEVNRIISDDYINSILASEKDIVHINVRKSSVDVSIMESAMDCIAKGGKKVEIAIESENGVDYSIVIDPDRIQEVKKLNLAFDISITNNNNNNTLKDGVEIPANSIVIKPAQKGEFGTTLQLSFMISDDLDTDNLYLFYINDDGEIEDYTDNLVIDGDKVTILVSHASEYVITDHNIAGAPATGTRNLFCTLAVTALSAAAFALVSKKRKKCI